MIIGAIISATSMAHRSINTILRPKKWTHILGLELGVCISFSPVYVAPQALAITRFSAIFQGMGNGLLPFVTGLFSSIHNPSRKILKISNFQTLFSESYTLHLFGGRGWSPVPPSGLALPVKAYRWSQPLLSAWKGQVGDLLGRFEELKAQAGGVEVTQGSGLDAEGLVPDHHNVRQPPPPRAARQI